MFTLACLLLFGPLSPDVSLADLRRFPSHKVALERWNFGDKHYDWVTHQRSTAVGPAWSFWEDWTQDAHQCKGVWFRLVIATDPSERFSTRLAHLRDLRRQLGERAWWGGEMPPEAPVWRFSRRE